MHTCRIHTGLFSEVIFMRSWKDKLTSRKFWCAVVGVVLSIMVIFGYSEEEKTKVTGLITATGVLISYIVGEGLTDAAHIKDTDDKQDGDKDA